MQQEHVACGSYVPYRTPTLRKPAVAVHHASSSMRAHATALLCHCNILQLLQNCNILQLLQNVFVTSIFLTHVFLAFSSERLVAPSKPPRDLHLWRLALPRMYGSTAVNQYSAGQGPASRFLEGALSSAFPYFADYLAEGIYLESHKYRPCPGSMQGFCGNNGGSHLV